MSSIKNFCKKSGLSSRISQNDINKMVRVAAEEVKVFITIIIVIVIIIIIIIIIIYFIILEL